MDCIINWCNNNVGFIEALLSIVGLIVSIIAIVVSIRTARLPYKKGVKLSKTFDYNFSINKETKKVSTKLIGVSLSAVNTGSRDINLTFLGLVIKKKCLKSSMRKLVKFKSDENNVGRIKPTEIASVNYSTVDILANLERDHFNYKIYIFATDSEGKNHRKYIDKVKKFLEDLGCSIDRE